MKALIATVAVMILSQTAFAGEGGAELTCRTGTKKTQISIFTADGGDASFELTLKDKNNKDVKTTYVTEILKANLELNDRSLNDEMPGAKVSPIVSIVESHVIAFVVVGNNKYESKALSLVSKAGTLKYTRGDYGSSKATFKAILSGTDPRTGGWLNEIEVACVYNYSI